MTGIYERRIVTGEDELSAALMRMVLEHCRRPEGMLDSFGVAAHATAMRILADDGLIRIDAADGDHIRATMLPETEAFLAWVAAADR